MGAPRVLIAAGVLAGAVAAATIPSAFDLDVAVPSGAPLEWKSSLPQRYVRPESLFALTRDRGAGTTAAPRARPLIRAVSVVRPAEVLTLDFAGHLGWQPLAVPRNLTGIASSDRPYPPLPDVDLYWRTTVSLLQWMLHPARVLRLEILGQLALLGEGALSGLDAAASMGELGGETRELRSAIGATPPRLPEPIAARDPFAAMMQRLVADELCLARPYANDLAFAERLVLLRDDIVPFVIPYLASDHSLARRNATALLALLDAPAATEALTRALVASPDLVVKLRAIHGLAQRRARSAAAAMRAELAAAPDPVVAAALIRALGDLGDADAIPQLLAPLAASAVRGELLIERLAALTRIDAGARRADVETFARPWLTVKGDAAAMLRPGGPPPPQAADSPDPPDARARIVEQLARLLFARLAPDDDARRAALFELFEGEADFNGRLVRFPCRAMGAVAPQNRYVFARALASFGGEGSVRLTRIAKDPTCEPELRLTAIEALPVAERIEFAADLSHDATAGLALELAALEILDQFNDARAVAAAQELALQVGFVLRDGDDPLEHFRLLLTVQLLGARNRLTTPALVELLRTADPRRAAHVDPLVDQVEAFLADVLRAGRKSSELHSLANRLLLSQLTQNLSARSAVGSFDADEAWLVGQAEAVLDRPKSEAVHRAAVRSIVEYLRIFIARFSPIGSVRNDAYGQVPLLEAVLTELARKADDAAVDVLAEVVRDRGHPQRAAACLALGATGNGSAGPHLLYALKDDEPFVRLCAYLGLRRLTHHDFFVDWLNGSERDLKRGFEEWGRWLVRSGR